MRKIPGLTNDLLARSTQLATKARDSRATAREAVPGVVPPEATMPPAKVADGVATLRIYDYIDQDGGYWGISANEFADAVDAIEDDYDRVELLINSGGGSVWDALAMLNTLRSLPVPVTARVDGIAASAASFIAVACDEVVMMPNSRLMIHDALGLCIGQAVDMREYADFLDDTSGNIAEIYATKTGGTVDEWRALMTAKGLMGQWYSAQEAVDAGLADRIGGTSSAPGDRVPAPAPKALACGCGLEGVEGLVHKDECATLNAPSTSDDDGFDGAAAYSDRSARMQQRRHQMNRERVSA